MKLVSFKDKNGAIGGGLLAGDVIHQLPNSGSDDVLSYIEAGGSGSFGKEIPLSEVTLLAPLQRPPRIFGIGLNYREHAAESKMAVQSVPTVFLKLPSSITGPDSDVLLPPDATQPDYEAELAVVIGKPGHRIAKGNWRDHVFGYTIVNDVSARGVQLATSQWTLGKSFPTFTPMGPWIVTADEIGDPHNMEIKLTLSGEVMQHANTRDLIFPIPELIAYISSIVPLESGDVISTGTPPGVGLGRNPQRWLRPDETMVIEIEGIGALRNRTRAVTAQFD
ncbi:MAG TPA: fumarylacetoacetate hydrolase family protein [Candidatus Aquilonibacter sp.]|nr:fumarylacetoacetate hydrolase family protein [Candidatus Aquilonibacter sp.]